MAMTGVVNASAFTLNANGISGLGVSADVKLTHPPK